MWRLSMSVLLTLVLEDVEADASHAIDIGMIDLREEVHLRWHHRIVLRQEQLQAEATAREATVLRGHMQQKTTKQTNAREKQMST